MYQVQGSRWMFASKQLLLIVSKIFQLRVHGSDTFHSACEKNNVYFWSRNYMWTCQNPKENQTNMSTVFFFSFLKLKANCKHTKFLWRGIWVSKLLQWYCKLWIRMPVCKEGLLWSSCLTYSLCRQFQTGKMEESKLLKPCSLQQWINFKC